MKEVDKIPISYRASSRAKYILGRVAMWGMMVEGEFGYRSQHARVTALIVPKNVLDARIAPTADHYGVEVIR
jgi:hypothetical protein